MTMQKRYLTYDEIMAERSARIPFAHLAGRSIAHEKDTWPRACRGDGTFRRARAGHKATQARWSRQGRR